MQRTRWLQFKSITGIQAQDALDRDAVMRAGKVESTPYQWHKQLLACAMFAFTSTSLAVGWQELPNTKLADACPPSNFNGTDYNFSYYCKNVIIAWNGGAFDPARNRLYIWGGGHNDYYGNEIYALDAVSSRLLRLTDPATPLADPNAKPAQRELHPFDGTQPNSRHTYGGLAFIEHADRLWAFSGALASRASGADSITWLFDPETNAWSRATPTGDIPGGTYGLVAAYDPESRLVYIHNRKGLYSYEYSESGGTYRKLKSDKDFGIHATAVVDSTRKLFLIIGKKGVRYYDISTGSNYKARDIKTTGDNEIVGHQAPGLAHDPVGGGIIGWIGNGKIYRLDTESFEWSSVALHSGPGPQPSQGTFGRFAYAPALDRFIVYNKAHQNGYLLDLPRGAQDTQAPMPPPNLTATTPLPSVVELRWQQATDNLGVAGYRVYKNGELLAETTQTKHAELSLSAGESHSYQVVAFDSAGNESARSTPATVTLPQRSTKGLPRGDCSAETRLASRTDVVLCEPWEDPNWWQHGYLNDPIVADPRPATSEDLALTEVVSDGCVSGSCLKVHMPKGTTKSLSLYWPLKNAELAPEQLFLRYYIRLGSDWNPDMCNANGKVTGAGGKFPGLADPRTWADPGGQCGNGGDQGDGLDCWSMRSFFGSCKSKNGTACNTVPNAVTRFGSYLYHYGQPSGTGINGNWDSNPSGQWTGGGGSCDSNPKNLYCGIGDGGVFAPERWYRVEMQVQMNTPGVPDGTIRGWIDGALSFEKSNVIFRLNEHDKLHNRVIWLNVYKGGVQGNCNDSAIFLDQLVATTDAPPGGVDAGTVLPPTLEFKPSSEKISLGESLELNWVSGRADSCEAAGHWNGPRPLSGQQTVAPEAQSTHFDLACEGPGGKTIRRIFVEVAGGTTPTVEPETPDTTPPVRPIAPRATLITNAAIHLEWIEPDDDSGIAGYRVYRNGLLIDTRADTQFQDLSLPSGTNFRYSIEAFDAAGNVSDPSPEIELATHGDQLNPADATITLFADSDTFLHPSTISALGTRDVLWLEGNSPLYLRFPLDALPAGKKVASARLKLRSVAQYGQLNAGVFTADQDWHELGATKDYADVQSRQAWKHPLGDWRDANGTSQGSAPISSTTISDTNTSKWIEWDVTDLIAHSHEGPIPSKGLVLRSLNGGANHFASKESATSEFQPRLEIEMVSTAATFTKAANDDTFLSSSSKQALGNWPYLEVAGTNRTVLLRFDLGEIPAGTTVEKAELKLHNTRQYWGGAVVGVFHVTKPWSEQGATRDYYNSAGALRWENKLGDWLDVNSTAQGMVPLAQATIPNTGTSQWVTWDVTSIVRAWLDQAVPNNGLILRSLSRGGGLFQSKEGNTQEFAPVLRLELSN